MSTLQNIEKKGTAAVKRLRSQKLAKGLPFMINSNELPTTQCYLEYPNGSIQLVVLSQTSRDFTVIRELSLPESNRLRATYKLTEPLVIIKSTSPKSPFTKKLKAMNALLGKAKLLS